MGTDHLLGPKFDDACLGLKSYMEINNNCFPGFLPPVSEKAANFLHPKRVIWETPVEKFAITDKGFRNKETIFSINGERVPIADYNRRFNTAVSVFLLSHGATLMYPENMPHCADTLRPLLEDGHKKIELTEEATEILSLQRASQDLYQKAPFQLGSHKAVMFCRRPGLEGSLFFVPPPKTGGYAQYPLEYRAEGWNVTSGGILDGGTSYQENLADFPGLVLAAVRSGMQIFDAGETQAILERAKNIRLAWSSGGDLPGSVHPPSPSCEDEPLSLPVALGCPGTVQKPRAV